MVHQTGRIAYELRRGLQIVLQVQQERLHMQLAEQLSHAGVLDDGAVVDDADVAAQLLGLFQVMGGEDDGDAYLIQLGQEGPHRTTQLDVDTRSWFVEDQQAWLMHQGTSNHQAPLHAAGQRKGRHITLVPQPKLDRTSTRLNSSHNCTSRMPSSA